MKIRAFLIIIMTSLCTVILTGQTLPSKSDILTQMQLVNDYWINGHSNPGNNGWARAAYFTGNMAMFQVYPDETYLNYALAWANQNNWDLNYRNNRPHHADDQCCSQTYLDLFEIEQDSSRIEKTIERIDAMIASGITDDWNWVDALYMAMPVFARLGVMFNDNTYLNRMHDLYTNTKVTRNLYDVTDGLWYRDHNYNAPEDTTENGKKIFWSRGNGWVFGAHVRTLNAISPADPDYAEYLATFRAMAQALKGAQRTDGFWGVNLADTLHYEGPETSGTGFFTYGIAWGISQGLLDSATYMPVITKAWNGLITKAVHPDGYLGYVQGVGSHPGSSQPVTYETTTDFGVGAFLLAGSELIKLASGEMPDPPVPEVNLALNGTIHAYSAQQSDPDNPATNAIDGSTSTRWSANTFPQWIEIDLGTVKSIYKTEIAPYQSRAYQYTISAKQNSGGTYQPLVDRSANTTAGTAITDTFPPHQARYLKLNVTGADGYTGAWVSILELRVFEAKNTAIKRTDASATARSFTLSPAYPNPFNPVTTIRFSLKKAGHIKLAVYDIMGREITTLTKGWTPAGSHTARLDAAAWPGGVYVCKLFNKNDFQTRKMTLLK